MNAKLLMVASSVFMGLLGIAMSFMPKEILETFDHSPDGLFQLALQLLSALYFGFAVLNWMAKTVLIGGIYARPLAMGNFSHFLIAAITLIKFSISNNAIPVFLYVLIAIYATFTILFAYKLFTHPKLNN